MRYYLNFKKSTTRNSHEHNETNRCELGGLRAKGNRGTCKTLLRLDSAHRHSSDGFVDGLGCPTGSLCESSVITQMGSCRVLGSVTGKHPSWPTRIAGGIPRASKANKTLADTTPSARRPSGCTIGKFKPCLTSPELDSSLVSEVSFCDVPGRARFAMPICIAKFAAELTTSVSPERRKDIAPGAISNFRLTSEDANLILDFFVRQAVRFVGMFMMRLRWICTDARRRRLNGAL